MKVNNSVRICSTGALCLGLLACSGSRAQSTQWPLAVPASQPAYSAELREDGVLGGEPAERVEGWLQGALRARGDSAQSDGTLASLGIWVLHQAYSAEQVVPARTQDDAARKLGFVGPVLGSLAVSSDRPDAEQHIRELVSDVPSNYPISRYGIARGRAHDVAIVLGNVEVALDDLPRHVAPGAALHVRGDVSKRFSHSSVFVTDPTGAVQQFRMPSRAIDATIRLLHPGSYKIEILGDGPTGPLVLANLPVEAGTPESAMQPLTPRTSDPNLTREAAEARMLELLNESRAKAAVNAVVADAELQSIARAHCEDMAEHHFVGHVSPTTGSAENRVRKARVRASRVAECVAREVTPEDAHDGLLSSPAHRMSMLDPLFTHVGVGVCFRQEPDAQRALLAVLLLARRPAAAELHQNPASLFAVIQSARGKQRLPKAVHEAGLQAAADAGMRALLASRDVPQRRAFEVANSVLQTDADRTRKNHAVCLTLSELLEARELEELPIVLEPEAVKFGLGVGVRNTQAGPVLSVLLAAEGADGKRINCR